MELKLTDEAVFDMVAGAGAGQYPWYVKFDPMWGPRKLEVVINDGDRDEAAILGVDEIRKAVIALVESGICPNLSALDWSDPEVDSEIDADWADCIIQYAVLGDVVFG